MKKASMAANIADANIQESNDEIMHSQASTQVKGTQEMFDSQLLDNSTIEDIPWGRLLPVRNKKGIVYDMVNHEYSFGRGTVDYQFTPELGLFDPMLFKVLSKEHFVITREPKNDNSHLIILEDKSFNGTFINSTLVGQNKKKYLRNNDVISLAHAKSKVFIFHDCLKNDSKDFPNEVNEKYIVTRKLGDGAYGEVRMAYSEATNLPVAIKIIKKKMMTEGGNHLRKDNNLSIIENEVKLLRSVDHPCIVKLLDIIDTLDYMYIVMEMAEGGELFDKISGGGPLSEATCKLYFYQLVHAIDYLHKKKITHRDIKPENILLATEEEFTKIKLTDFGLSKLAASVMKTFCGTMLYVAPEILKNVEERQYTNKADMWSLGVVLYVCLLGTVPFDGNDDQMRVQNVCKGKFIKSTAKYKALPKGAKNLIEKLLLVDPSKRLSAEETLNHEWLQDKEMIEQANQLFKSDKPIIKRSPLKRSRDEEDDDHKITDKTPKIMSGIEFSM